MSLLAAYLGDTTDLAIPLTWAGAAFAPGDDWGLIFTAKTAATDADTAAVIQKASGLGITAAGYTATVSLVSADTVDLTVTTLEWDVQAQHVDTGAVRTVARGKLSLYQDVTRATTTSVPITTTTDPAPFGPSLPAGLADITSITITAGDDLELVQDGVTYYLPLYRRA